MTCRSSSPVRNHRRGDWKHAPSVLNEVPRVEASESPDPSDFLDASAFRDLGECAGRIGDVEDARVACDKKLLQVGGDLTRRRFLVSDLGFVRQFLRWRRTQEEGGRTKERMMCSKASVPRCHSWYVASNGWSSASPKT